jgi:hypothetical protein
MDLRLRDFAHVRATGAPDSAGDIAFDVDLALEEATDVLAAVGGVGPIVALPSG